MKIRVTRQYTITTEHEIKVYTDAGKMDVEISLAIQANPNVIDRIRGFENVVEAGCLNSPKPRLELMFPTRHIEAKNGE